MEATKRELREVQEFHRIIEEGWQDELKNLPCPYKEKQKELWEIGAERAILLKTLKVHNQILDELIKHALSVATFKDEDVDILYERKVTTLLEITPETLRNKIEGFLSESGIPLND